MAELERHANAGQYSPSCVSFHIARDPEFLQGIQDGCTLLPQEWDLTGQHGWWNVQDLVQFILKELTPDSQAKEHQVRRCFDACPDTPIYNLGLVTGYLARFFQASRREVQ